MKKYLQEDQTCIQTHNMVPKTAALPYSHRGLELKTVAADIHG